MGEKCKFCKTVFQNPAVYYTVPRGTTEDLLCENSYLTKFGITFYLFVIVKSSNQHVLCLRIYSSKSCSGVLATFNLLGDQYLCVSVSEPKKNAISQEALGPFVWVELFLREHIRSCAGDATRKPFHFVRCWVSSRFSGLLSPPLRASLFAPQATVLCLGLSRHPGKALAGLAHHTRAEQYLCVSAL